MRDGKHKCPGPRCSEWIPYRMLACQRHWHQVPRSVPNAVFAAWDNGDGAGSRAHRAAIRRAIAAMKPLQITSA